MLKNTVSQKTPFILIVQEYCGTFILSGTCFPVGTVSSMINSSKIGLHSHFFS